LHEEGWAAHGMVISSPLGAGALGAMALKEYPHDAELYRSVTDVGSFEPEQSR
jgi:hypothetical protein